ncbi:MAG: MurR/RpiR family transcriptional regulator [Clostridia bacterium]|nr:MurR/RpiR family transcriptional regulator [Clostridia bacterium]
MPARMKLSSVYSTLPPAERKVADFILANPDEAAHMVINEIAHHSGVSVPSVTRLARKLGYGGFMDFRVSLASGASSVKSESTLPISADDTDDLLIQKLMVGHMSAIESTLRVLDTERLSNLADDILSCRRLVWFGVGSCSKLSSIFSDALCRMGLDSVVISDRALLRLYSDRLHEGDMAIAITRTGKTQRTLEAIRTAKENGAKTALISNLANSPGEQYSDYFFCTSRQDELYRISGYETFSSICALLETLLTLVERKRGFESKAQFLDLMTSQK